MTIIFYIENFFYCILLKKHQFFRFKNFEDSFLEIFKYHIEKINTCKMFLNIERDKTYFFRKKFWGVNYAWNDPIIMFLGIHTYNGHYI